MSKRALPLLLSVAMGLSACGGPKPYDPDNPYPGYSYGDPVTIEIPVAPDREGGASSDGLGGLSPNLIPIGDAADGTVHRALAGFPLDAIPPGAQIVEAALIVYVSGIELGAPHEDLKRLFVDLVDFGEAVDAADFTDGVLLSTIGLLSKASGEVVRSTDITIAVVEALDQGLPNADFRIRFDVPTNLDGGADQVFLNGSEDLARSGVTTVLSVTFMEEIR